MEPVLLILDPQQLPPVGWHRGGPGGTFVTWMTDFPRESNHLPSSRIIPPSGLRLSGVLKVKTAFSLISWVLLQIFLICDEKAISNSLFKQRQFQGISDHLFVSQEMRNTEQPK